MHESKQSNQVLWVLLLPCLLLCLFVGEMIVSVGLIGIVGAGAVGLASLAMLVGFGLPILRIGQEQPPAKRPPKKFAGSVGTNW